MERGCATFRANLLRVRIFVTRALPINLRDLVPPSIDVAVSPHDRPLTADEIASLGADADGIVSMLSDPFDETLLARLPRLKVVANYAVGHDNIAGAAARTRGIVVTNTPDVLTEATADLAMTLVLAVARRVRESERLLRTGGYRGWSPTLLLGADLHGRTMGLFGFGRIGRAVAARARGFGMRIVYTSRTRAPREIEDALGATAVTKDELLRQSDVLSLHAPMSEATRHTIDAAALAAMRPGAILINTARGPLIDEAALVAALIAGRLRGAGLDVFEDEPAVHPALLGRDDVVLLPHLGSATAGTREEMARIAIENCVAVLEARPTRTPPVN